jgi:hypothetical protein
LNGSTVEGGAEKEHHVQAHLFLTSLMASPMDVQGLAGNKS